MTIELYPELIKREDLSPDEGFGPEIDEDCNTIYEATKGWGANAQKVITALATKDANERWKVSKRYKELYDQPLDELMKKEFSGDFKFGMTCLAMPLDEAECYMLKKGTDGIGANHHVVYSIMCGRTNDEVNRIKKNYFKLYTKDLGKLLASELHGDMERLVFNAMQGGEEVYDPQFHTDEKAADDADAIYKMGQGKFFGTDEKSIFKILCASPSEHLKNISRIYADKYGFTLLKAMEKELGGNVRDGCLFVVGMKLKPYETIAQLIKTACAGIGTDELLLTCCIIRYQMVMKDVMGAHIELFGKSVHDRVRHECGGKYKTLLLEILNAVWPEDA